MNIEDAASHPDYHYVEGSGEEKYPGCCGVPVVSKAGCLGVSVVQSRRARKLSPLDEAFIETLASHLALMPENLILPRLNPGSENIRISGVSGSAGIGTGFARLEDPVQTTTVAIEYSTNTQEEINAWSALLRVTNDSLVAELRAISNHVPADATSIFDAYRMILKDDVFTGHVASEIRNGYVIPTALKLSIEHFAAMEDPYL